MSYCYRHSQAVCASCNLYERLRLYCGVIRFHSGIVKLSSPKRSSFENRCLDLRPASARRGLPSGEGSLPKESMIDRLETMACEPKCVVGGRMDCENTPHLRY